MPGGEKVSIGGAISANTIGKDSNSKISSFGDSILSLDVLTENGKIKNYSKNSLNKYVSDNGLTIKSYDSYADHYANTLAIWKNEFNRKWDLIKKQGFDMTLRECGNFIFLIAKRDLNQKISI